MPRQDPVRHRVGKRVELAVGERVARGANRKPIGMPSDLSLEARRNRLLDLGFRKSHEGRSRH
jgi:hypothetical protein